MEMSLSLADVKQLQGEAGAMENDQRLRAIVAERIGRELMTKVAELEAKVKELTPPETPKEV